MGKGENGKGQEGGIVAKLGWSYVSSKDKRRKAARNEQKKESQ